jgi:hypothetical protein
MGVWGSGSWEQRDQPGGPLQNDWSHLLAWCIAFWLDSGMLALEQLRFKLRRTSSTAVLALMSDVAI